MSSQDILKGVGALCPAVYQCRVPRERPTETETG